MSCVLAGSADFRESDVGQAGVRRQLKRGDIFVTRSKTPYELDWKSPVGEELDFIIIHLAVDQFLAALEAVYPGKVDEVEVIDFFGRDEALAHLCFACSEMLSTRVPGNSERVTALMHLFAAYLVEKYTDAASEKPEYRGGLPIGKLRKVEDYVRERLAEDISVESLAPVIGTQFIPLFAHVQAGHGNVSTAIRQARAYRSRSEAHLRNLPECHRDRARSRLHEPEPFC
jgi:AraC family transcriptional regulator